MYVKTTDYRSANAGQEFCASLKETGFAILSHHPIPQALVEGVYKDWEGFFASEDKFYYLFDPEATPQSGYFPFKSENAKGYPTKDLKEFFHYYDERNLPKGMGDCTRLLFEAMTHLAGEVLGWIEAGLPAEIRDDLSMPLSQMIEGSDMNLVRIIHYPPLQTEEEEGAVRAAAHEDIDLLTMLPAATTTGLQVKDSAGRWHDVSCDFGTLAFNAGDMLQMATKGYYKSTSHRVVNPIGDAAYEPRYSLPLFLHPRNTVRLSDTHTAGSYLDERLRELGLRPTAA